MVNYREKIRLKSQDYITHVLLPVLVAHVIRLPVYSKI